MFPKQTRLPLGSMHLGGASVRSRTMKKTHIIVVGAVALVLLVIGFQWSASRRALESSVAAIAPVGNTHAQPGNSSDTAPTASQASLAKPESAVAAFNAWAENFVATSSRDEQEQLVAEGEELAQWRREALEELIQTNPHQALAEMVPYHLRKALPTSVQALLEEPVSGRGDLSVVAMHSSDSSATQGSLFRQMELDGRTYDAFVYGWRAGQRSGKDMPFHGISIGNTLAVHADVVRVLSLEEAADMLASGEEEIPWAEPDSRETDSKQRPVVIKVGRKLARVASEAGAIDLNRRLTDIEMSESGLSTSSEANLSFFFGLGAQGRKRLLYIRINFPDDPREPIGESRAYDMMSEVSQFFSDASYNTLSISTVVTPVLTLPQPKEFYRVSGPTFAGAFGNVLLDARAAARAAGFIPEEYELELVDAVTIPGFATGGLSSIGGRNNLMQSPGPSTIGRALGFNFGLSYANAWNTRDEPRSIDGDPYPPNPRAPNANYPIDIDSRIGRDGINVPGRSHEERDPFDCMGGGGVPLGHYNAISKYVLGWLPEHSLRGISKSQTNRIYAFDAPERVDGRLYGLLVHKKSLRNYWIQFRHLWTNNVWLNNGVELHWPSTGPFDPDDTGGTDLIDTTPGSQGGMNDSAIVVGRTFTDEEAHLHITPLAKGGVRPEQWVDVVVNIGPFPGNRAPSLNLIASGLNVPTNATVTFTAEASDLDQDGLAYFWEENDQPLGTNSPVVSRTFPAEGHYVIRCEVSDMKGGKTIQHLLITVGSPANFVMRGRVIDPDNQPVPGVRVHNGRLGSEYRVAFTDSQGAYTITDIAAGNYDNRAFLYGYKTDPLTFFNPVTISDANAANLDHLAFPITKVSVSIGNDADEEDGGAGTFIVSRTGDTNSSLVVPYVLTGRASSGQDYQPPSTNVVIIPSGQFSTIFSIQPVSDDIGEGPESITMSLDLQTKAVRVSSILTNVGGTNIIITLTNEVFFRGYELLIQNGNYIWHQTYPVYVLGNAEATLNILDSDPPSLPSVSLNYFGFVGNGTALESGNGSAVVYVSRGGSLAEPLTVYYRLTGTATNGADYVHLPGRITIPAGQEVVALPIVPMDDSLVEGNESVVVEIVPDPGYTGSGSVSLTIVDDDLPLVTLISPDDVASETGGNPAVFRVFRAGDLSQELQVYYQITGGTATEAGDFLPLSRSVIIPAGQISIDFLVTAIADAAVEGNESLTLMLVDATTYNIGMPNSATITIRDQPLPLVTLQVTDANATEPSDSAVYTLTRTGPVTNSLTVNFAVGGTATAADYAAIGTNVIFAPGASTATITISPIDDDYHETNETVIIRLLPASTYHLGAVFQGTNIIAWNDGSQLPEVSFVVQHSSVPESGGSSSLVLVQLSGEITASNRAPVNVAWRVVGGSAVRGADYSLENSGYLTFNFRQPLVQAINVGAVNDGDVEPTETVVLALFDPDLFVTNFVTVTNGMIVQTNEVVSRAPTNAFLGPYRTHTLSILDNDLSTVSLSVLDPEAAESGQDPASFIVSRSGSTNADQTVFFSIGGSAAYGSDYAPIGDSVTIPAGASSVTLFIQPSDDPEEEFDETVRVTLVRAPGSQIGSETASMSIRDNDGTLQFLTSVYRVAENGGEALISVVRTRDTNRAGRVEFQIFDGTAIRNQDYKATNGVLDFLPGDVFKTISVHLLDDSIVEPDETVLLVLTNATGGVPIGGQRTATLFINNDDTAYDFSTNTFYVNENGGPAKVIVYRSGLLDSSSTVEFSALTNSATAPADFVVITNQVITFGVGETNRTVNVAINNDTLFEGNETVSLTLQNPGTNTLLGTNIVASLVIVDDECSLAFSSPTYSTNEYVPFASLVVTRTGGTVNPVFVDFATSDGTATNAQDYLAQQGRVNFTGDGFVLLPGGSGQLVFRPGETNKIINIALLDDTLGEGVETFSVALSNAGTTAPNTPAGSIMLGRDGTPTNAVVRILDNESPGGIDYEYNPGAGANGPLHAVALQNDKAVFGGAFTAVDGVNFTRIARLHLSGVLDVSFNPGAGANGDVLAIATQSEGRIYIGGLFTTVDGVDRARIARLNANGGFDGAFNASGANGAVRALAVQANGQVLAGGEFSQMNGVSRTRLARLNPDGSLDGTFAPPVNGPVNAIVVQTDGKILIGGTFNDVSGNSRVGVARLNSDGTLDQSFDPRAGALGAVNALASVGGKVVLGGAFTFFDGVPRNRLARLNSDGSLDVGFASGLGANGAVLALGINAGGRIVVGGEFTTIDGISRNRIARLRLDGSLDTGFDPGTGADAVVRTLAVQLDTAIVIGGDFANINGVPRNRIARIHGDERSNTIAIDLASSSISVIENAGPAQVSVLRIGNTAVPFSVTLIASNSPGPNSATPGADFVPTNVVLSFAPGEVSKFVNIQIIDDTQIEPDEYIKVWFTNATANLDLSGTSSGTITIVDNEQSFRFATNRFDISESLPFASVTILREGLRSGTVSVQFAATNGTAIFPEDFVATNTVVTFGDGEGSKTVQVRIIQDRIQEPLETVQLALSNPVGGGLGTPSAVLLFINDDIVPGSIDMTFDPGVGANGRVRSMVQTPDGKVVLGGSFTMFNNTNRNYLARINSDGAHDLSFYSGVGPNSVVLSVGTLNDGRILVGGGFTSFNSNAIRRIARLGTNGALDLNFNQVPNFNAAVNAVAAQTNNRVLVGGGFNLPTRGISLLRLDGSQDTTFNPGTGANGPVHAVLAMEDRRVIIGGAFNSVDSVPARCVARLLADGSVDSGFVVDAITNGTVFAVALQPDGKVIVGGEFFLNTSGTRVNVARLHSDGSLDASFDAGTGANGPVYSVIVQRSGKIIVGGDFTSFDGIPRGRYARLLSSGDVDVPFNPGPGADGAVYSLLLLPDDNTLIAGDFQNVNGISRRGVARIRSDDNEIRIVSIRHLGGEVRVIINSNPGMNYVLEGSSNLPNWTPLGTNTAADVTLEFIDPGVGATFFKFYRVRQ